MREAIKKIYHKLIKYQHGLNYQYRVANYKVYQDHFTGGKGIEIGGPSRIFEYYGAVPLYPIIQELDGVNFSGNTVWEGHIDQGKTFRFDERKRVGYQHIGEASDLSFIPDGKYDFLISSNCLEHLANPLKAIQEWMRVIRERGSLIIVVPHKDRTFDHNRPVTSFEHLKTDFENNTGEDDKTHLEEILSLHDLALDAPAGNAEQFKARCLQNMENRCMHHHVYSISLLYTIFRYFNKQIMDIDVLKEGDIVIFIRKFPSMPTDQQVMMNALSKSPFQTDMNDLSNNLLG